MTGKHYNWHKRWQVDLSACTASHDSGLIVRFEAHPDAHQVSDNLTEWRARSSLNELDLANHTRRLMDEAARAWGRAAGAHVEAYIKACASGVKAAHGIWKITVPEPKDDLQRVALELFKAEIKGSAGITPTVETWH